MSSLREDALCECGCDEKPGLAPQSRASIGWRKGYPKRFVTGHNLRLNRKYPAFPPGVIVDRQDESLAQRYSWTFSSNGYICGQAPISRERPLLHRLIAKAPKGVLVDHINGNKLDNRRCNLRLVNLAKNLQNLTHLRSDNTSGYRGVSWDRRKKKWHARAQVNSKEYAIGYFDDLQEAAHAAYNWRFANMPGFIPENDPCRLDALTAAVKSAGLDLAEQAAIARGVGS